MYAKLEDKKTSSATTIDLRSDTVSLPTDRMREAMANAVLGDDVCEEDPTIIELEQKCAKLFEKEAAIFVPSGTMGNLIAIMIHCHKRGDEAIVGSNSHVFLYEQGGAAGIAGVLLNPIKNNDDGTYSLDELRMKIRGSDIHEPKTSLAIVENTHNICGGKVISLKWLDEIATVCKANEMKLHMDGARVFHAAEYLKVPVSRIARDCDSLTFCLSKSLCAPVGSVLVGSSEFIKRARRMRKALGGGMRQAGVLAAAGLVALEDIVPKLGDDHKHLLKIAQAVHNLKSPFVDIDINAVQTNICMMEFKQPNKFSALDFVNRIKEVTDDELSAGVKDSSGNGIIIKAWARDEWNCVRLVVYHHINDDLVDLAIKKFEYCIKQIA